MRRHPIAFRTVALALALGVAAPAALLAAPLAARADDAAAAAATSFSADVPPEVSSPTAILVDMDTGTVLFERDADERRPPASVTKVMTALVVLENADLDDEVTVEASDFDEVTAESSVAGLVAGETLTVRDLLACLLLPSGNDAAYVLARHVAGSWQAFVDMMNEEAARLGCTGTHFADPCGLASDDHYTTARDLVLVLEAAMGHPEFAEISGSATWDLPATSGNAARTLENTDLLLDPESPVYMGGTVVACKTGFTYAAGRCLAAVGERDGMRLAAVVLGAADEPDESGVTPNFYDVRDLLEWGFGAWRTGEVVSEGDALGAADVALSDDGDAVEALADGSITATVPRDTTLDDLTLTPAWEGTDPETGAFMAPVEEGQALGSVSVSLDGRELGTLDVRAARAMGLSVPALVLWWLSDPAHAAVAVACVVAVVVVAGLLAARASHRRRRSRYTIAVGQRRQVRPGVGGKKLKMPSSAHGGHGRHMRR